MLKPMIVFGIVLCAGLVVAVYHVENHVKSLRTELREVERQIDRGKEDIHVLKAEWSYLNQPDRLRGMAEQYLNMATIQPAQFAPVEGIPLRAVLVSERVAPGE